MQCAATNHTPIQNSLHDTISIHKLTNACTQLLTTPLTANQDHQVREIEKLSQNTMIIKLHQGGLMVDQSICRNGYGKNSTPT